MHTPHIGNGYIDCKFLQRHVEELIARCGNSRAASEYSDVSRHTMYRILHGRCYGVQRATAARLLWSLRNKRREDRRNGEVSVRMLKVAQEKMLSERSFRSHKTRGHLD